MRQFTFIASSMRKVLTHLVFLWRSVCCTITGQQQIAGSSGGGEAIYWLKIRTILSSQIIKVEWSCNWYLRKIISTPNSWQKTPIFDLLGVWFNRNKRHLHWTIQLCEDTWWEDGVFILWGRDQMAPLYILYNTWAKGNPPTLPSLRYPLASSSHKWICQLMFQGPEQQMISSHKAKDKENKSLDFCWEKPKKRKRHFLSYKQHRAGVREQTLSSQFLLRSAFSIVWPCWPLYPTKACTKKYWPNSTQAFFRLKIPPYLCRSWEFSPSSKSI